MIRVLLKTHFFYKFLIMKSFGFFLPLSMSGREITVHSSWFVSFLKLFQRITSKNRNCLITCLVIRYILIKYSKYILIVHNNFLHYLIHLNIQSIRTQCSVLTKKKEKVSLHLITNHTDFLYKQPKIQRQSD